MTQRQVQARAAGHQLLDTLVPADLPDLSATYDAAGAAAAAQAAAATDATTKANAAYAAAIAASAPTTRTITAGSGLTGGGTLAADRTLAADFGSAAGKVTQGNDARLTDARTPTAHKTSHQSGGSDAVDVTGLAGLPTAASLGLVIGTNVEAHDPDLTTIAGLSPTNDDVIQRKAGAWANRTIAQLLTDLAAPGTTFQPLDSDLTALAALSTTALGRSLLEVANAAAIRTIAGTVIGTNVQAWDADLDSLASVGLTAAGLALLDDASAAAQRTTLDLLSSTAQRLGRAVNAGTVLYQLPGRALTGTGTLSPTVNQLSYWPLWTPTVISIDQVAFNVTTTPASAAKVRIGIYNVDSNNQPSGNPLADVEVNVANGFTGVKTASVAVTLGPGSFLLAVNLDVTMAMRSYVGGPIHGMIDVAMGNGTVISFMAIASAYAAMPAPGTAWTFSTGGSVNVPVVLRVSTP